MGKNGKTRQISHFFTKFDVKWRNFAKCPATFRNYLRFYETLRDFLQLIALHENFKWYTKI